MYRQALNEYLYGVQKTVYPTVYCTVLELYKSYDITGTIVEFSRRVFVGRPTVLHFCLQQHNSHDCSAVSMMKEEIISVGRVYSSWYP